jgi:hypothetical protein
MTTSLRQKIQLSAFEISLPYQRVFPAKLAASIFSTSTRFLLQPGEIRASPHAFALPRDWR